MNNKEIRSDLDKIISELSQVLSAFDEEQINIVPFKDSWTAGQLAQHVIMSCSGFSDLVNGPVKDTERNPDEMAKNIKKDFLDFSTKMKSPEFVVPPFKDYKKDELLNSLENLKTKFNQAAETLDLTKTCLAFKLPRSGFLTRWEALNFVLYHTQRHVHQLKNIRQNVIESITVKQ